MKQLSLHLLLLLVIAGGIFFTNLGSARLWDRDEPRNAGCAVEMMARGDWVVPTFNHELRYQKPVLLYWLMMSAYWMFGTNEFAARFWSAVLGVGTVMLTYGLGRRLFHPNVGLLAGIVLASSMMFDVAARAATPDSVLIFFSTLAIYLYVVGTFVREKSVDEESGATLWGELSLRQEGCWFPQSWWLGAAMYAAMGLAVLTKGPVGFVLPTAIIGMFLLIMRLPPLKKNYWQNQGWLGKLCLTCARPFHPWHFLKTCWSMRLWMGVLVVLLVAAPWYVWVGLKTDGDFTRIFFLSENLGRATTAMENHGGGWWYYPLALLIGFFPWSIFWVPLTIGTDRSLTAGRKFPIVFLLCWIGVQVGLFSLASTKLPSYVTPCYPALALLTSWGLIQWATDTSPVGNGWFKLAQSAMILTGLGLAAGLVFLCWKILGGGWWLTGLAAIPLIGGIAGLWLTWRAQNRAAMISFAVTAVVFCFGLFGFGTQTVGLYQTSLHLLQHERVQQPETAVATYGCMESSWVVYANKPVYELSRDPATAATTLDRQNWWDQKPRVSPEQFLQEFQSTMIITTDEHWEALQSRLPEHYEIVAETGYFLRDEKLLLVGPPQAALPAETQANAQSAPANDPVVR